MANTKEIIERLSKLKEVIELLSDLRVKYSFDDYKKNYERQLSLERAFQLAIEISIDIGEIIIAELDLPSAYSNREVFQVLKEEKIISKNLADRFERVAGFRNIIVYDYMKLDLKKMYNYLQNNLDDFNDFIKEITHFLKKKKH